MKKSCCIIIIMLTSFVFNVFSQGFSWPFDKEQRRVTKDVALEYVKSKFTGKDVDYYGSLETSPLAIGNSISTFSDDVDPSFNPNDPLYSKNWIIFIDEEPMKGWGHNCSVYFIPKNITVDKGVSTISAITPTKIEHFMYPPAQYSKFLTPWEVKNRYGNNAGIQLKVPMSTNLENSESEVAKRTYAIILSGGITPSSNYMRYWNDCSYIYQTLTNKYGVSKDNIVPIMADGDDPSLDSYDYETGTFRSSSLDLDFDGIDELEYAATKDNVVSELEKMALKVSPEDHFFFFVIDHGGTDDYNTKSYICLWNGEKLYDTELAELFDKINARSINVVLGQCFSGGFIDDLQKSGRVIATACTGSESSWACSDIPYDEFVFQWTNAVNECNIISGAAVTSDVDRSGTVTMDEAFNYAKCADRQNESPMYSSMPLSVGEDLAFNNIPLDVDLYMRDNVEDTGKEPNTTTDKFWASPDVWVRNSDDGYVHQECEPLKVTELDQNIYVYFRITNRGTKDYDGKGKYLHAYWANTAFGQTADAWLGISNSDDGTPFGGELFDPIQISVPIKAGESAIIYKKDVMPRGIAEKCLAEGIDAHVCILARIKNGFGDDPQSIDSLKAMIGMKAESKRLVQKNLTVIESVDPSTNGVPVLLRGMTSQPLGYGLKLLSDKQSDVFDKVEISLNLSAPILNVWKAGGMKGANIYYSPSKPQTVCLLNENSQITDMALTDSQYGDVNCICRLLANTEISEYDTLRFHIAQIDDNGDYVGGEEFEIRVNPRAAIVPNASNEIVDGQYLLTANNINESVAYEWYDANNNIVGTEKTVKVPLEKFGQYKLRVVADKDGAVSYAEINVANSMNIESVGCLNAENNSVDVRISLPATKKTKIKVSSISNPVYNREFAVREKSNSTKADLSGCPKGVYVVSLVENGVTMDTKSVVVE